MKCPNCGAEMKEGTLYCEKCGEDIHIVPDFEPELEQNIVQSLEPAIREATGGNGAQPQPGGTVREQGGAPRTRAVVRAAWAGIALLCLILLAGGAAVAVHYSSSFQIRLARMAAESGNYERAISHYQRAMELEPSKIDLLFNLADVYFQMNNREQYTEILTEIIDNPYADETQLESAYGKLIAVYRAQGDYQSIQDMLLACGSDSIRAVYQSYLPQAPEFSIPAGDYDSVKALKLTADGDGTIYYTTDGSDPDTGSSVYDKPILLEDGSYRIRAVYVDENGISSEIAEAEYTVEARELDAPELNLDSGEYNLPVTIEVLDDTDDVYYTVDGSIPTKNSTPYTGPISMMPGKNVYRFIRIRNGASSSVEERIYSLELFTDLTPQLAVEKVITYLVESGQIRDVLGHFDDTECAYQYECQSILRIAPAQSGQQTGDADSESDYYVITEVLVDEAGNRTETGRRYAVEAYTGACWGLTTDEYGNDALTELPSDTSELQE